MLRLDLLQATNCNSKSSQVNYASTLDAVRHKHNKHSKALPTPTRMLSVPALESSNGRQNEGKKTRDITAGTKKNN